MAKVQILDLAAGADITSFTYPAATASNPADNTFTRKTLSNYFNNVAGALGPDAPFDTAFSVTNGAFFTSTSKLSLPEKKAGTIESHGFAIYGTDPAWNTPKRVLQFNTANLSTNTQPVVIKTFPTNYTLADVTTGLTGYDSAVVGFDPLTDPTGNQNHADYRTFIGLNAPLGTNTATRVFILTTNAYTVSQATSILKFYGSNSEIQLDGGGSTRMESYAGTYVGDGQNRAVPHAIVAWYGP